MCPLLCKHPATQVTFDMDIIMALFCEMFTFLCTIKYYVVLKLETQSQHSNVSTTYFNTVK